MSLPADLPASFADRVFEIEGIVQGVGFRPFVVRLAKEHGVRGWVRNDGRGVTLRAVGFPVVLDALAKELLAGAPPAARIEVLRQRNTDGARDLPAVPAQGFIILASELAEELSVAIAPDLALCGDCRRELNTPENRRHAYPFINCTNCGPRYSVIEALPYDRARTTMRHFTLCAECAREFHDVLDRRYHAQANACPACGPRVLLYDRDGRVLATRADAIEAAATALRSGRIVAVKGIGGFHLMADAASEEAVRELRRRKHREEKPLAVMFPSLVSLRAAAEITDEEEGWLTSATAPIVLLRRRNGALLAEAVAPGNPRIGALLPYTPLHVLLLEAAGGPLVATSGNLSEEPLCSDDDEARARLGAIADLFLGHNRPIAHPVDDSVVRRAGDVCVVLRRARGLAPAPILLPANLRAYESLLCVGGQMKNTIAITIGRRLVLSPHLGDLGSPISIAAFRRAAALLSAIHGGHCECVVCDAHPDYASTKFAESLGRPVVRVQHHLAHILSCLLEHGGGPTRSLGVAWDGTGYGLDGTIWGGEFISIDREANIARRIAHLLPFRLPGGEAAVREPRRAALGLAHVLFAGERTPLERLAASLGFTQRETEILLAMLDREFQAPLTTSAGRLFDGIAALLGLRLHSTFEGQAAMDVEFAADHYHEDPARWSLPITLGASGAWIIDWRPMIAASLEERGRGVHSELAARFHASLAGSIAEIAQRSGFTSVALSGGCFQNVRLLQNATCALQSVGCSVLQHHDLPPNDGGLSAGQALGALWGLTTLRPCPLERQ